MSREDIHDLLAGALAVAACLALTLFAVFGLVACSPGERPVLITSVAAEDDVTSPLAARQYRRAITREGRVVWGMTPDLIPVFGGQMLQESGFRTDAVSPVGAAGAAQMMPKTAEWLAQTYPEIGPVDVMNMDWSIRAMVRYDKALFDRAKYADTCNRAGAMLSQYNGGGKWHDKRQAMSSTPSDFWGSVRTINPGITAANQRENERYSQVIVFTHQPKFRTWGAMTC